MAESGTATVLSDRYAGRALIGVEGGTALAGGGPTTYNMALPTGFGDCFLLDCCAYITSIATAAPVGSAASNYGCLFALNTSGGARRDIIGDGILVVVYSSQIQASPRKSFEPVIWRTDESLFITVPEIDTNAAPTALWNVYARVMRLRQ